MFEFITIQSIFLLLSLGVFAGLMAGLLGVGGGLVIVPALIFYFEKIGFSAIFLTQMAVATSLATIIFTSLSSVRSHHKNGSVDWLLVKNLAVGLAIGGLLGALFASLLKGVFLQLLFGVFAVLMSVHMFMQLKPKQSSNKFEQETTTKKMPGKLGQYVTGLFIAFISAIFGIGGGSLSVPTLSWFGVDMKKAVAVSAACGLPIALFSVLGFIYAGLQRDDLPEGSLGFVYLPALFCISASSMIAAHFGAQLAHKLPAKKLKQIFSLFLFIIGLRLIVGSLS